MEQPRWKRSLEMDGVQAEAVTVVTGAASGIGAGVLQRLVDNGANVVGVDVAWEEGRIEKTIHGGKLLRIQCDVADSSQVERLATHVNGAMGPVKALVHCAGIGLWFRRVAEITVEDWDRVLAVNLRAAFLLAKVFMASLVGTRGTVIFVSSVHGVATVPGCGAYATSKAGLFGLTKALAVDYGQLGVRANCIVLGSVDTEMTRQYEAEAVAHGVTDLTIPSWQRCTVAEVADVVEYLLSDHSMFMNGALINVDGGLLATL